MVSRAATVFWMFALFLRVGAKEADPEERLHKYLFNDTYNKSIRPGYVQDGKKLPLTIDVLFAPFRIVAVDGRLETMALLVYQVETWDDPRLVWKPEDFGNMSKIYVKPEVIWTPRSYLPNMLTLNRDDKSEELSVVVVLNETNPTAAKVQLMTYASFQERCRFDMAYFPFDQQSCNMCISGTQYPKDEVTYVTDVYVQEIFVQGGEWHLLGIHGFSANMGETATACLTINVQRRFIYYIINLFIPTITICVLNTIGLFAAIDAEQDELDFAALGQTTLLSLGVMLLTVADQTPKGTPQVSLLGVFFLAMIFQTILASLMAVYLRKWHRGQTTSAKMAIMTGTTKIGNVKHGFVKKHAAKLCMIAQLIAITIITASVIGVGLSKLELWTAARNVTKS